MKYNLQSAATSLFYEHKRMPHGFHASLAAFKLKN